MGLSWWWVVLAVVVVALFVAVVLLRSRRRRADAAPANVEIAAAAAGGVAGAVGAGAVAVTHAEKDTTPPAGESALEEPGVDAGDSEADTTEQSSAEPDADRDEGDAGTANSLADSIPAPREEQPLTGAPAESADRSPPEPRIPEPAGSALAGIDSGLVGPATSVAAAAAAVSAAAARPGPYPGSLLPATDGSSPSPDHQVKVNEGSRRFHTPDSPFYVRTRGDAWFRTPDEARAAGFTAWDA